MGSLCSIDALDERIVDILDRTELVSTRFCRATPNSTQFKGYELSISGILNLMILDNR